MNVHRRFVKLYRQIANSWLSAALVVLVTFAFVTRLLDDFPIQPDGLRSIATVGYFDDSPDLSSLIKRLSTVSQQHVPGYFLALYAWVQFVEWEPLLLRLLSVYFGIISLALMYRLGRDFVSREAGLVGLVMLSSLAFYNYWYLPIRMYTMFVAAELLMLWIYFRVISRHSHAPRAYIALLLACLTFLNTQIFSLAIASGLAIFHLLFVPKTRQWLALTVVGLIAGIIFLPWLSVLLTGTEEIAAGEFGDIDVLSPIDLVTTIFSLGTNASIFFLGILVLSFKQVIEGDRVTIALWLITIVATVFYLVVNLLTEGIDLHRARYFVVLFPPIILLLNKGLTNLSRWKIVSFLILLFWLASGLLYQRRVGSDYFVRSYNTIPIHLIERHLRNDFRDGDLITGWTDGLNFDYRIEEYGGITDFYFADHAVDIALKHNYQLGQLGDDEIVAILAEDFADQERIWLAYELDNSVRYRDLFQQVLELGYERCKRDTSVVGVVLELYQSNGCG